jgi:hypothetical protein
MKRIVLAIALLSTAYGFGQVNEAPVKKESESKTGTKVQQESNPEIKIGKINKPVIDKYTKPREVSKPVEEKEPIKD